MDNNNNNNNEGFNHDLYGLMDMDLSDNLKQIILPLIVIEVKAEHGRLRQLNENNTGRLSNTIEQIKAMNNASKGQIIRTLRELQGVRDDRRLPPPGFIDVLQMASEGVEGHPNGMQLNGGRKRKYRKTYNKKTKKHSRRHRHTRRHKHTSRRR
jgi:hypothetical protein